jgi:hypothetical protein
VTASAGRSSSWIGAALRDGRLDRSEPTGWRRLPRQAVVPDRVPVPCTEAAAWREADRLFRQDPRWQGGDVASSVDLGGGRTLWLFGDSWVAPVAGGTRAVGARMVSNTVAVQAGRDPSSARMTFHWRTAADGTPEAIFPPHGDEWLWFGRSASPPRTPGKASTRWVRRTP